MNTRRWSVRAFQAALLVLVGWLVWRSLAPELQRVSAADFLQWRPDAVLLAASLLLLIAVYAAHALLWRRILVDLHAPRPSARTTFRVYFLASLGRYVPGKVWQLAGLAVLAQRNGLPAGTAMGAALLGQLGFLSSGLVLLALLLPSYAGLWPALGAGVLLAGAAAALYTIGATPIGHRLRAALLVRAGFARDRLATAFRIADRVQVRDAARWELLYAGTWLVLGLAFALLVAAFVPEARNASAARYFAGVVAASYLAGYLVFILPAGAGMREATMSLLLAQHPAVPASAALVVAVASRIWFTAAELLPLALLPVLPDGAPAQPLDSETARTL